jgi:glucosamine kinase
VSFVVGVDGGGTRTRAVITDQNGMELARAEAPGAVVTADAPGDAVEAVSEAVRAAAERAGVGLPVDGMWAGLAGAGLNDVRAAVARELQAAQLATRVVVGTDVEAAFQDALGSGPGILLISGTGSIAWARHPTAGVIRVGGWGEGLGDEGSGYAIGMGALRAVAQAEDGRGPATALRDELLEHLSLKEPEGLVAWIAGASKGDVAALVPLVSRVAAGGDPGAAGILAAAVEDLTTHLRTVLERAGSWPEVPGLVLWGGLLGEGGPLRDALVAAAGHYPVQLMARDVDPPIGAAKMALAALAAPVGGD